LMRTAGTDEPRAAVTVTRAARFDFACGRQWRRGRRHRSPARRLRRRRLRRAELLAAVAGQARDRFRERLARDLQR
jgi:hypothetical protein